MQNILLRHDMGRTPKAFEKRRVQLRLPDQCLALFDGYSSEQISRLVARALLTMSPDIELGDRSVSVIRPPEPITITICRIFVRQTQIQLLFPEKRDDFREIVKGKLNYEWSNPYWLRTFDPDVRCDRAAEVAHQLLMAGFCVQVEHEAVKQKALFGQYEPEHYRRIEASTVKPFDGWFQICWPRGEDLYDKASKITAAKYSSGAIYVPPEHFREVQDFAQMHGFWLSPEVEALMQSAEQDWQNAFVITQLQQNLKLMPPPKIEPPDLSLVAVPDELRDDD